jgi:hypothetical protein
LYKDGTRLVAQLLAKGSLLQEYPNWPTLTFQMDPFLGDNFKSPSDKKMRLGDLSKDGTSLVAQQFSTVTL